MLTLREFIQINEGIFDAQDITFKDFSTANELLEIFNLDNPLTQDKTELQKLYFNIDLKLEDGTAVKDSVNNNKADFKKYGLANYVEGAADKDMDKIMAKFDKADNEIGDDTVGTADGRMIVRVLKMKDGSTRPMAIAIFKGK